MSNNNDRTPDIILHTKTISNYITEVEEISELGADHLGLRIKLDIEKQIQEEIFRYNFQKTDMDSVNRIILAYLDSLDNDVIQQNIINFSEKLSETILRCTPKTKCNFYSHELPPFIIRLIKKKRQMYREYLVNRDPAAKTDLNQLNKNIQFLVQEYKTHKWIQIC